jgi:hypothetical protein
LETITKAKESSNSESIREIHDSLPIFAVLLARIDGSPIVRAECIEK